MADVEQLVSQLKKYALTKRGAEQSDDKVLVPYVSWGDFLAISENNGVARIPVRVASLKQHRAAHPVIQESKYVERDDHAYMEVPLDADLPLEFLHSLIDDAYEIVWNKLDDSDRLNIELSEFPYDESIVLDRLIDGHGLTNQAKVIRKLARPAVLLRTKEPPEMKTALGASKIGGKPDLPSATPWPVYSDGKPLAFLAQLNLAEIAKVGSPIKGLPSDGLLSLFSAWGWVEDGDMDPEVPETGWDEQTGWTVVLHTPSGESLERRKAPRGVNSFKAAILDLIPILSLPNHAIEPSVSELDWTEDQFDAFDMMQMSFRCVQMKHWQGYGSESHHQLGGYAKFQQQYPEELLDTGRAMLLQIGTDHHPEMCWGDGGELTFYADAKAMAKGRFERLWGTCQGG
jgi:uncharacterized protein YwqG